MKNELSNEIEIPDKKENEDDILLDSKAGNVDSFNNKKEFIKEPLLPEQEYNNKEKLFLRILKAPLIILFFFLILFGSIIFTIIYIAFYFGKKPNFKIVDLDWDNIDLNDRKYQNYLFDNGLEVLLIQDKLFDRDGGGITIGKGYMDNPFNEGIATIANYLLQLIAIKDDETKNIIKDYYGKYDLWPEEHFISYGFEILNNGFKKFLYYFSLILNPEKISKYYDDFIDDILGIMDYNYEIQKDDFYSKEMHILNYLVYGLKNETTNDDILPEGCSESVQKYTSNNQLKELVLNYTKKMINPSNIKIAFFSKYKFLISSKYMKKYFNYLTKMKSHKIDEDEFEIGNFSKSQIIYYREKYYDSNFIDILYYIDRVGNESYSELEYKANYLNYIIDFINEKKKGSLYYLLTKNSNFNIKSIVPDYKILFKRKIEFIISIELNCLENINDIIFITYQYMNSIIKNATGANKIQMDRYMDLKTIFYQDMKYLDKTFETIDLAKNNARAFFLYKYKIKYYFYPRVIPMDENDTQDSIENESFKYFKQIKPENSVVVLGLRENDGMKFTCNNNSLFPLNCSYFKDYNKSRYTKYYEVYYINKNFTFNSSIFDNISSSNINIKYQNNSYISKHNKSFIDIKEEESDIIELKNISLFNKFYFKKNTKFKLPRVYISLNLFHPYLRPMFEDKNISNCIYFKIIEMFAAIKRKINEELADAIRAGNTIEFGQNEDFLFINVFCYEDVAFKIMKKIKKIIYDTDWELTDFVSNNEIYKNEAFSDFFIFNRMDINSISRYYFYSKLKNHIFNKYEFFPEEFEKGQYQECINNSFNNNEFKKLTTFPIIGYIYGYYTEEGAENISKLFEPKFNSSEFEELLKDCNNTEIENNTVENFINWVNEIKEFSENAKIEIHPKVYNNSYEDCINFRITYLKFNESELNVTLFKSILEKVSLGGILQDISMFKYKNIFFELTFFNDNNDHELLKDEILEKAWNSTLFNMYEYNEKADNIGNRYYYIKKNFILSLFKEQSSLKQRANDEFQNYLYNGTVIDPMDIMNLYNKKYKNKKFDKNELNWTINYFLNVLDRKRIDIYPIGVE